MNITCSSAKKITVAIKKNLQEACPTNVQYEKMGESVIHSQWCWFPLVGCRNEIPPYPTPGLWRSLTHPEQDSIKQLPDAVREVPEGNAGDGGERVINCKFYGAREFAKGVDGRLKEVHRCRNKNIEFLYCETAKRFKICDGLPEGV